MEMKRLKRHICAFLAAFWVLMAPLSVSATSGSSVQEKKSELSDAQNKKDDLESRLSELKDLKKELERSRNSLNNYVTELDAGLNEIQTRISELDQLVAEKKQQLERIEEDLAKAVKEEARQYSQMKKRIRFMYEKSSVTYMQLLVGSSSISDLLNKATYIEQLSAYDRDMLVEYQKTKKRIEELQEDLGEEQEALEAVRKEATANEDAMETLIEDKQEELEAYESDIANKEAAIKEYEDQIAAQDATIFALEKAVRDAERAQTASGNSIKYGGGKFAWPAPNYTRISDDYGWRIHPTLGVKKFHNGVDMAAPTGSPILAAADGQVVAASYSSSMGNYVMINHGSGLFTIYMHASSLGVSTGASVKKGAQIATVGSTGRSTGPHLHFGVRMNGEYVSPWAYLNG